MLPETERPHGPQKLCGWASPEEDLASPEAPLTPTAPLGPQAAMPVAEKARGGRAAMQDRPSLQAQREGGEAEIKPPRDCFAGADPGPPPVPAPPSEPNGSSAARHAQPLSPNCGVACSGTLQVELCNHSLWLKFHRQQNEMKLNRPGRAMFPFLIYQVRGMEPRARYRVFVDMVRTDQHHWRYEKAQWAPHAPEASKIPGNQIYEHPDSPDTGARWMRGRYITFNKLKLTNTEPAAQSASRAIWLQSQHRYRPRLHVEELACGDQEAPAAPSRTHVFSFPETEFIAVTAYRNAEIIRLKIDHNPYATAFRRESPAAGALSAGPPPGPAAAAAPCAEAASDPAGQWPLLPEAQDRDPGKSLPGPQPLSAQAGALPPSLLSPTSAAAAPYDDRPEATGSGTGEPESLLQTSRGHRTDCLQSGLSKPLEPAPGAREQPRLHEEIWAQGTQMDSEAAARGERAPKKRRLSPGPSGSRAMSPAGAHGEAQAQRVPATEASAKASPEITSEDPGDLLVIEDAGVRADNGELRAGPCSSPSSPCAMPLTPLRGAAAAAAATAWHRSKLWTPARRAPLLHLQWLRSRGSAHPTGGAHNSVQKLPGHQWGIAAHLYLHTLFLEPKKNQVFKNKSGPI